MLTRIDPNLDNTERLLEQILPGILTDQRVGFLVPAGESGNVLARIRTMISRKRKKLLTNGVKPKRFELRSSVHPETHAGFRMECIVLWRHVGESHMMSETLEDLLTNG